MGEVAEELRCSSATIYRAITQGAFPAVKIRGRYIVPAKALDELADEAMARGGAVDIAELLKDRKTAREL